MELSGVIVEVISGAPVNTFSRPIQSLPEIIVTLACRLSPDLGVRVRCGIWRKTDVACCVDDCQVSLWIQLVIISTYLPHPSSCVVAQPVSVFFTRRGRF